MRSKKVESGAGVGPERQWSARLHDRLWQPAEGKRRAEVAHGIYEQWYPRRPRECCRSDRRPSEVIRNDLRTGNSPVRCVQVLVVDDRGNADDLYTI